MPLEPDRARWDEVVRALSRCLAAGDTWTGVHSVRVASHALALARVLGLPEEVTEDVRIGALLHDIGKLAIPEYILLKPTSLTSEEYELVRRHPQQGVEILQGLESVPGTVLQIVLHHHEWWDGSGYPHGLRGSDIPLGSQLIAIVESYDFLVSDLPYRRGVPHKQASQLLLNERGTQFNPALLDTFLRLIEKPGALHDGQNTSLTR